MDIELKTIEELYGEEMACFCRKHFIYILNTPNLLLKTLKEHFYESHDLYKDLEKNNELNKFKNFIKATVEDQNQIFKRIKECMKEKGYTLYECNDCKDVEKFYKYYEEDIDIEYVFDMYKGESNVFFAIKENAEKIKRPENKEEYGSSVLFMVCNPNSLFIRNRYYKDIKLDDERLIEDFKKYSKLLRQKEMEIPKYTKVSGKYYKYNYIINGNYYCPNNIFIKENQVISYEKERYILFDYFLLDLKEKTISCLDETIEDSFPDTIGNIQKIEIENEKRNRKIIIENDAGQKQKIILNQNNQMIFYKNNEVEKIEDNFLHHQVALKSIKLSNAKEIGNSFLCESQLKKISLPKAEKIGFEFLSYCKELKEVNIPNAEEMEKFSFLENKRHKKLLKLIVSNNLKEYVKDILNDERNILEEQKKENGYSFTLQKRV